MSGSPALGHDDLALSQPMDSPSPPGRHVQLRKNQLPITSSLRQGTPARAIRPASDGYLIRLDPLFLILGFFFLLPRPNDCLLCLPTTFSHPDASVPLQTPPTVLQSMALHRAERTLFLRAKHYRRKRGPLRSRPRTTSCMCCSIVRDILRVILETRQMDHEEHGTCLRDESENPVSTNLNEA
jgi:hypothetical protein